MAASGNTLFDQATKNIMRKKKQQKWLDFRVQIQVIKLAVLLSFYKVARPQMFLILNI